ncbi:hypothetical protein GGTG_01237 [Gaeumannomyces tritici R3-111a-1]|uniref:Uncharacterized protein n=1 Tax=Gaeumannomyces tritici (strain R3-111a-1) TaxID=644352 RepID=J3NJ03_GAET3|nr:hypothetical protein GGTG_01237 [Gaeumannomyces tritici R3-111a-1]EJT81253.1 hypothetical protein GGTG_01237 [Gaeumannomyces tritici R3-111a-1]
MAGRSSNSSSSSSSTKIFPLIRARGPFPLDNACSAPHNVGCPRKYLHMQVLLRSSGSSSSSRSASGCYAHGDRTLAASSTCRQTMARTRSETLVVISSSSSSTQGPGPSEQQRHDVNEKAVARKGKVDPFGSQAA